jgi:hypothetical protein
MRPEAALILVKVIHTIAWAFFAGCILALPVAALSGQLGLAAWLIGVVLVEVVILVANRWRCPLTGLAERFTDDRRDDFDIYLPLWLARYNKQLFGALFLLGLMVTLWCWLR